MCTAIKKAAGFSITVTKVTPVGSLSGNVTTNIYGLPMSFF